MTKDTAFEKVEHPVNDMAGEDYRPPHRCCVCDALATKALYHDGKVTYHCDNHVPP